MVIEVLVLYIALTRAPHECEAGERVLSLESGDAVAITAIGHGEPTVCFGADLEQALAHDMALVAEVRHVLIEKADNNILVWIALDNPIATVRERVFQKELELIEGFPEIDFDFNVIPAMNRDPRQFASSAKVVYSREDNGAH
jgi:hypothetical protein